MTLLQQFQKELTSLVFTLIGALLLYLFRARVRLVWAIPHGFTFLLQSSTVAAAQPAAQQGQVQNSLPQTFNVNTGSVIVSNSGRVPATDVEVTFNWKPDNYNIWPARPYETLTSADNRFTLKFANLAPKEQFGVELISAKELPLVVSVRCKERVGKQLQMRPTVVYPNWMLVSFFLLALLGAASVVYLILKLGALMM